MLINTPGHPSLRKIVLLTPKGGSGKTTLATNLAGYLAVTGRKVALMDLGDSSQMIRAASGICAFEKSYGSLPVTISYSSTPSE